MNVMFFRFYREKQTHLTLNTQRIANTQFCQFQVNFFFRVVFVGTAIKMYARAEAEFMFGEQSSVH